MSFTGAEGKTGLPGASGVLEKKPRNSGQYKNYGRLVFKIEPGEKLLWRYDLDRGWSLNVVDAKAQR